MTSDMTREEALNKVRQMSLPKETMEILETLAPELRRSEDERIRKEMIRYFTEMKKGGSAALPYDDCIAYLERQKETGIRWFKSDNVKNPDKPYIDKAGMFYTTDGRMCPASEIEKQKEQKPVEINEYEIIKKHITEDVLSSEVNKRLKECGWYVTENPSQWSEEDEKVLNELLDYCNTENATWYNWLKSLRPQPKQNDVITPNKEFFQWIYDRLVNVHNEDPNVDYMISFKKRIEELSFNEPSWKPSEEQMEAFKDYIEDFQAKAKAAVGGWNNFDVMIELYEQLKKL